MSSVARHATAIWAVLVAATIASWWLADHNGIGGWTVPALMLIALFKVRFVFLDFMELRDMAGPWRMVFEAWIAACAIAITALYSYAQH